MVYATTNADKQIQTNTHTGIQTLEYRHTGLSVGLPPLDSTTIYYIVNKMYQYKLYARIYYHFDRHYVPQGTPLVTSHETKYIHIRTRGGCTH